MEIRNEVFLAGKKILFQADNSKGAPKTTWDTQRHCQQEGQNNGNDTDHKGVAHLGHAVQIVHCVGIIVNIVLQNDRVSGVKRAS